MIYIYNRLGRRFPHLLTCWPGDLLLRRAQGAGSRAQCGRNIDTLVEGTWPDTWMTWWFRLLVGWFFDFPWTNPLVLRIHGAAIYGNIYHQYTPNVGIYAIHGSYGLALRIANGALPRSSMKKFDHCCLLFLCFSPLAMIFEALSNTHGTLLIAELTGRSTWSTYH